MTGCESPVCLLANALAPSSFKSILPKPLSITGNGLNAELSSNAFFDASTNCCSGNVIRYVGGKVMSESLRNGEAVVVVVLSN